MIRSLALVLLALSGTVGYAQTIDDFESYADTLALWDAWPFATALDTATPNPSTGVQSQLRSCTTSPSGGCYSLRSFDPALDLRDGEVYVWVRLAPGGPEPSSVFFELRDGAAGSCASEEIYLSDTSWHRLSIHPSDSVECNFLTDPSDIVEIWLLQTNRAAGSESALLACNWDDLGFFGPLVFADGFESGGTGEWSDVVGELP